MWNKDRAREYHKEYRRMNKEKLLQDKKDWYLKNKEKHIQNVIIWGKANKEKRKQYRKDNKKQLQARDAKRRACKLNQTPKWADLKAITEFYKNCPEGYHVDHIIPLQGKNVRGLHVLENLQYLLASENCRKGNRF